MKLDTARTGEPMLVLGPNGPSGPSGPRDPGDPSDPSGPTSSVTRRLAELGIRPGAALRIQSRTSGGGAILAIGDDRIAVSHQILASIEVGPEVRPHG
jgi:Fe2+ transport system protein FeoA